MSVGPLGMGSLPVSPGLRPMGRVALVPKGQGVLPWAAFPGRHPVHPYTGLLLGTSKVKGQGGTPSWGKQEVSWDPGVEQGPQVHSLGLSP